MVYLPGDRRERETLRRRLLTWYQRSGRDLPWRRTRDPYRIWISEVMLQQTRVAAVIPYYERFVARFPDIASLAAAPESEVLAAWSGLGYYARARNLQRAARAILTRGGFPSDYASIRALAGVGDYTAAALASIAFGLPYAAVDGNVRRVLARLTARPGDVRSAATLATELLDRRRPGEFNQALMELGATLCLPRRPACPACPLNKMCQAHLAGEEELYPVKPARRAPVRVERVALLILRRGHLLLRLRAKDERRLAGFWELPEPRDVPEASLKKRIGRFRHAIVNQDHQVVVWEAAVRGKPSGFEWVLLTELAKLPLATATRKALAVYFHQKGEPG